MINTLSPPQKRFLGWAVFCVLAVWSIYALKSILMPFVIGSLAAYIFNPTVVWLQKRGIPRSVGTTFVILLFFLTLGGSVFIAFPFLKDQLYKIAHLFPIYAERLHAILHPYLEKFAPYIDTKSFEMFQEKASPYIQEMFSWGVTMLKNLFDNSLALVNLMSLIFLTPVVAFYLLRDWPKILNALDHLLPRDHVQTIRHQLLLINQTLGGYIRGQTLVCLALALFYSLSLTFVGLNFAVTLGIITGVLAFIPYVGYLISLITAMGLAFAQFDDWHRIGAVALVYIIGIVFESYVLVPRLVGDRVGLHPVWIIFALLACGMLFGFLGLLIALPIAATIGVVVRFGVQKYLESPYYKPLRKR